MTRLAPGQTAWPTEFSEADEDAAVVLAQWAATAIENARLYETSERRRDEAERAVLGLRAARDITDGRRLDLRTRARARTP